MDWFPHGHQGSPLSFKENILTDENISRSLTLKDDFEREITYLRLSVTDRCDLRCTYCMAENMTFLPRKDLLSIEELEAICAVFITRGVRKIRLTGGEPLVRKNIMQLIKKLSIHLDRGKLDEITLTTNGTQLVKYAKQLKSYGVERINVSLDSLDPEVFSKLTRRQVLPQVLEGIDAALDAGLKVKINTVALKGVNEFEIPSLMEWAHGRGMDMTLIEVMPMGEIEEDRVDQYLPLSVIRDRLEGSHTLMDTPIRTGGPARYVRVKGTGGVLGFITPLTNNFCAGCNRLRMTCTGQIYMCLGHSDHVDLRDAIRGTNPTFDVFAALDHAMRRKPERHNFEIKRRGTTPTVLRHMSVTGG
jgi:cyclic pyranopterin phosphate synthase